MKPREEEFFKRLSEMWLPILRADGFDVSRPWQFVRVRDPFIDVVSAQSKSDHSACAVNLGLHLIFLPAPSGKSVRVETIEEADCEVRVRLTPTPTMSDHWWRFGSNVRETDAAVADLVGVYKSRGREFFDQYRALPGPFESITPADIREGKFDRLLPISTKVRAALLAARIYDHLGNADRAREFARVGLEHVGMAVGPKKALKEILSRNEP